MTGDRPLAGVLLMLGFCILAPLGDGIAKLLGPTTPLLQLLLVRFGFQGAALLPLALLTGKRLWWSARITALAALRTALHIAGIGMMFLALRHLPLADAIAIAFVMPFLLLFLGRTFLGEEAGPRRIAAAAAGFLGTLLIVQPSFAAVGAPALLPLGVALIFALFMLVTRRIARETDPVGLQATSGLMATAMLLPAALLFAGGPADLALAPVPEGQLVLYAALGALGTAAHLLMTWSLRFAPASTLAPMQYLEIPAATAIGWLLFRDFPSGLSLLGIAITVAAGLYVIRQEHRQARAPARPSPPPAPPAA